MRETVRKKSVYTLHKATYHLLLWGLRILCIAGVGMAVYLAKVPPVTMAKACEVLHALCISAVILAVGGFVLDVDLKKKEE